MTVILVLNGPNLNLLGDREPDNYGIKSLEAINDELIALGKQFNVEVRCFQSNHEGVLIDSLQEARKWAQGVIFNPGGYTHTSVALRDAIAAIGIPVIETHLSNIYAREDFRKVSFISAVCKGKIVGFGWRSYTLALRALIDILSENT
jgi:3-dehydroquinate dehydratase-2